MLRRIYNNIKQKGFRNTYLDIWSRIASYFYFSPEIIKCQRQLYAYNYLKKYLKATNTPEPVSEESGTENKTIWMLWFQGEENAPDIVKRCIASIKKHCKGYEIIVLNEETVFKYIDLPDYIILKYKSGIIKPALYSDLIRLSLLIKHGGIWIDATCFMTGTLRDYIQNSSFFCFKTNQISHFEILKGSSWFIKAEKNNKLLIRVKDMLFKYCEKEVFIVNYFLFHLSLSLVIEEDKECRRIWDSIPYICNMNPHVLQFHLYDKYSNEYFKEICNMSSIHKLTYTLKQEMSETKDTFLHRILSEEADGF